MGLFMLNWVLPFDRKLKVTWVLSVHLVRWWSILPRLRRPVSCLWLLNINVGENVNVYVVVCDKVVHRHKLTDLHLFSTLFVWRLRFVDRRPLKSTVPYWLDLRQETLVHLLNLFNWRWRLNFSLDRSSLPKSILLLNGRAIVLIVLECTQNLVFSLVFCNLSWRRIPNFSFRRPYIFDHLVNAPYLLVGFWRCDIRIYGPKLRLINVRGSPRRLSIGGDNGRVSSWECHFASLEHLDSSKASIDNRAILYHRNIATHRRKYLLRNHLLHHHLFYFHLR